VSVLMAAWKLLGPAGIVGLVLSLSLGALLAIQKGETRHWKKQSARYEQLYHDEHDARVATIAHYRQATIDARALDQANIRHVVGDQTAITERSDHDYQSRLAAARAAAQRLRPRPGPGGAAGGAGRGASVPSVSAAVRAAADAAPQDRLSGGDALVATEQAIQLDELIKWVRAQHAVKP
jgi:hypothetical protein